MGGPRGREGTVPWEVGRALPEDRLTNQLNKEPSPDEQGNRRDEGKRPFAHEGKDK